MEESRDARAAARTARGFFFAVALLEARGAFPARRNSKNRYPIRLETKLKFPAESEIDKKILVINRRGKVPRTRATGASFNSALGVCVPFAEGKRATRMFPKGKVVFERRRRIRSSRSIDKKEERRRR